jgi:2-C-methyl-D-erythritol 4-phosphate cytidylyltransferase
MIVVALVLAAGRGARLGRAEPKAMVRIAGRSLLHWSAEALGRAPVVDAVLAVLPAGRAEEFGSLRRGWTGPARLLEPVIGGETRQDSVARGLAAIAHQLPDAEYVLVHDAARCLVQPDDAQRVLDSARETGAALPVIAVGDTVKIVDGGRVTSTPDRRTLALAQTPQAFEIGILRRSLEKAERDGFRGTDCASLVERLGVEVKTCAGRIENLKITHPWDLEIAEARLRGSAP